mgnify:CR=1 FL=1
MAQYNTIAESNNFIVLDDYEKYSVLNEPSVVYQTEASLEHEFIQDLRNQGYEYLPELNTPESLISQAILSSRKQEKSRMIISMILCLMMAILKIYIW